MKKAAPILIALLLAACGGSSRDSEMMEDGSGMMEADSGYYSGWDLDSALHPQTILAYGFNGNDLDADHGAPLRLYAPHELGYKLTKYLTRITFTDERPGGYWEDQGYPWYGGV